MTLNKMVDKLKELKFVVELNGHPRTVTRETQSEMNDALERRTLTDEKLYLI